MHVNVVTQKDKTRNNTMIARNKQRKVVGNDDSDYYSLLQGENPLSDYSKQV